MLQSALGLIILFSVNKGARSSENPTLSDWKILLLAFLNI